MGIWDKRANKAGALAGMWIGFLSCIIYMVGSRFFGLDIWGIRTISSGLFGIPMGFIAIYAVSRMTAPPSQELQDFVESVRIPKGAAAAHEVVEQLLPGGTAPSFGFSTAMPYSPTPSRLGMPTP